MIYLVRKVLTDGNNKKETRVIFCSYKQKGWNRNTHGLRKLRGGEAKEDKEHHTWP